MVKPGSFNGKRSAAGLDPAPLPLIELRPGDTLLFDAKQSLRLPRLAADEARPKLAALVALWAQGMKRPLPFFEHRLGVAQGDRAGSGKAGGRQGGTCPLQRRLHGDGEGQDLRRPLLPGTR